MNDAVIKGFNDDDDDYCFEMSKLRDDFESSVFKINTTNRGNGKPASSFMISDEISTNCYSNEKQTAKIKQQKLENIEIPEEAAEKNQQEIQINNENDEADIINREINYDEGKRSDRNDYTDPSSKSVLIIRFRKFFNRGGSDISFDGGGRSDREVFPTTWDLNDSSNITDPNSGYEKHHTKKKQQKRKSKLLSPFSALRKYFLKSLIPSKYPRFDESNNNNNNVQDDGNNGISVGNGINATCSVPAVNKLNFLLHKTNDAIVDENEFTKIRNNIKMSNYLLPSKIPMKIDSAYRHHRRLNSSDFSKLIIGPNKIIQTDRPQITNENDDNCQMCCQAALVEDNDDKHWILSVMGKFSSDRVKLNYNDDDAKIITTDVDGFVSNLNKRTMKCEEPTITMNFAIEQQVLDEVGYDSLQLLNDNYLCISDLDEYLSDRYIDEYLKRRPDDDDSNKTKKNAEQTEEQQIPNESSPLPIEHKAKIRLTEGKRTTEIVVVDDDRDCSSKKDAADTFVSSSRIPRSRNLKSQQTVAANLLKDRRIRDDDKKSADGKVPANTDLKKKKKIGGRVYKDSAAAELGGDKKNANSNDQRNTLEAGDGGAAELGKNVTIEISKIPRFYGLNIIADTNFHPKPSRTLIGKYKTKIPILTNNNNNVSVTNVNPNVHHKLLPYFGKEHRTKILLPTTMAASAPRDLVELFDKLGPIAPKLIDRIQRPKPKSRIRTNRRRNAANGSNADKSNGRIITERQTAAVEEIIGMAFLNTTQMIEI